MLRFAQHPGGLGVREAFLMQWLGQLTTANLLGTILGFRIVAIAADPHVKRAYLGEEDEVLVDPDDDPAHAETAA